MEFWKMHGCGNDYVVVDDRDDEVKNPNEMACKICDRKFGIGSDGLILLRDSELADFSMKMYNLDGSEGEMCGNGIRCLGKYVYENQLFHAREVSVETLSGIKELELHIKEGKVDYVTVNMGEPITKAAKIPVEAAKETIVEEPFDFEDETYNVTCIGMGNPHAVIFVDNLDEVNVKRLGPVIERHKRFPNRTNVEFVQIICENTIHVKVWERGVGETLSCGTGACAGVAACILTGRTNDEVTVHLEGGTLNVRYDRKKDQIFMTGPTKVVFCGRYFEK